MDLGSRYILMLLVCVCASCHAYWIVESVGNFMSTAGHYINVVAEGAEKVAVGIQTIENILTDAIEEDCEFECPNGAQPRPNPKHKRTANGCGSLGVKWETDLLPLEQLSLCCDKHDYCYDTCNEDKDICDKKFKRCLYKLCDRHKKNIDGAVLTRCKAAAKLMFTGTIALGCTAYKDAQAVACLCDAKPNEEL